MTVKSIIARNWLNVSVGAFIVLGVLALLALAVQVSGSTLFGSKSHYRVSALFENASGLGPMARVTVAGVTVGKVTAVTIDTQTLMARVDMNINSDIDYLSIDSSASILTSGLLGEKYVGISVGAEEDVLQDNDMIEDTQSSVVLEELIGKILINFGGNN